MKALISTFSLFSFFQMRTFHFCSIFCLKCFLADSIKIHLNNKNNKSAIFFFKKCYKIVTKQRHYGTYYACPSDDSTDSSILEQEIIFYSSIMMFQWFSILVSKFSNLQMPLELLKVLMALFQNYIYWQAYWNLYRLSQHKGW